MSDIIIPENEPIQQEINQEIKKKRIMSEKQLASLKKGRETKALRAQQKKLEKNENIEPLEDSGQIQEKVIDIQENSGELLEEITEEDKPQPLLRQRKKKK